DKWGSLLCHCEERSDVAILCRNYQLRTNPQPEIAATSVRTGLAMTNGAAYYVIARSAATWQSRVGTSLKAIGVHILCLRMLWLREE
ncbi:MAG: hypothetical protein ACI4V3_05750, partial [Faecousia sp.]